MNKEKLDNSFLYGTAIAATQNEGYLINSWTQWEKMRPIPQSGFTTALWTNFDFYLKRLIELKSNSFRLSIEWSRIEPEDDCYDYESLNKYKSWIIKLKENGIEPIVTLHHFTNPLWFENSGSWLRKDAIEKFTQFAGVVANSLNGLVKYWITFNEPLAYIAGGWLLGLRPPGEKFRICKFLKVMRAIQQTHIEVYKLLHKINPNSLVSIAKNMAEFKAANDTCIENQFVKLGNYIYNDYFLNILTNNSLFEFPLLSFFIPCLGKLLCGIRDFFGNCRDYIDYIGLNHYNVVTITACEGFRLNKLFNISLINPESNNPVNELDFEVSFNSLSTVLDRLKKYNLPILIIENGTTQINNSNKIKAEYLKRNMEIVRNKILKDGMDIRGYLWWTFVHNYEWESGYKPNFGLYDINFKLLNELCEENKPLTDDVISINIAGEEFIKIAETYF